jgi:hypothetical protein
MTKNWKLCACTRGIFLSHLSSYSTKAAAEKAVPKKFQGRHPNFLPEIVLVYMGQEISRWQNPKLN